MPDESFLDIGPSGLKPPDTEKFDQLESTGMSAGTVLNEFDLPSSKTEDVDAGSIEPIVVGEATVILEPRPINDSHKVIPYRPDTILDGWSSRNFGVRAASIRGRSHRVDGSPRQDDFALMLRGDDQLIVAVADGVSGAKQSHLGATHAARYSTQWLNTNLADPVENTDWKGLIEGVAWSLVELGSAVLSLPAVKAEEAESVIATTLVCGVIESNGELGATVHLVNVGDSGAWIYDSGKFSRVVGGKSESDGGLTSSSVVGLPRVPTSVDVTNVELRIGQVLLLGTDGFGDPLGDGEGALGALFGTVLKMQLPTMLQFAHVLDFSRATFDDDRTLIAIWPVHVDEAS